ncbi:MAG TPA: GNAT family N-acetyltransferase [Streptosporangiaceae bacterium]|nr:GNAT family N-acetyltransferase [Streptosporangiaceae bacterium]
MVEGVRFEHHDGAGARALSGPVSLVHRDAYGAIIATGDPFESPAAFMERFEGHASHPDLDLVLASIGDEPVGQAWGFPRARPTFGDARPSFAFCEIMVRKAWTGQGIAHALHDELLGDRSEPQAELYVRPENTRAYRAYLKWGWFKVGETRPDMADAPVFDVLHLSLPIVR